MSVNLRFQKGSTVIQTSLRDEAFPELLKLVTDFESQEEVRQAPAESDVLPEWSISNDQNKKSVEERSEFAKKWLSEHSPAETLAFFGWETFPERILALGGLIEASGNNVGWRNADIENQFNAARQPAPTNFARDIGNAIKSGMIGTITPRTYSLTRSGWMKIYEQIIKKIVTTPTQTE